MADIATGACEGAAGYDQRSEAGTAVEHGAAACFTHHGTKEVMGVVFGKAIRVDKTSVEGEIANGTGCVVDVIWWVNEVAVWQAHHSAWGSNLSLVKDLTPLYAARGGGLEVYWKPGDWVACVGADWWRCRGITVENGESCWVTAGVRAEIGGFVHVDPETVDVNAIRCTKEAGEFAVPVALGGWIEPVWEGRNPRPDDT